MHRTNPSCSPLTLCVALALAPSLACVGDGAVLLHTSANVNYDDLDQDGTTTTGGDEPATSTSSSSSGEDPEDTLEPLAKFDVGSPHASPGDAFIPSTCDLSYQAKSSMGCIFYGVDLDREDDADPTPYALAVANIQDLEMRAKVAAREDGEWIELMQEFIPPGEAHLFELPDRHHDGSGWVDDGAYRVTTDFPAVVYQFNGLDGSKPEGSGASLLVPSTSWTSSYEVIGWQSSSPTNRPAYLTVAAAIPGSQVSVHPSVETLAGNLIEEGSLGQVLTAAIDVGDVVHVAAAHSDDEVQYGLTGTLVQSGGEHPVGVWSGVACGSIPADEDTCNHMEEQLTSHLYGYEFIAPRMPLRDFGNPEATLWMIYALEDNTVVTIEGKPKPDSPPARTDMLDAGEVVEVWASGSDQHYGDLEIHATKLIAVMGYITNATELPGESFLGGPEMVQLSPVDRFLPRYLAYVPDGWSVATLSLIREAGAAIEINGAPVPDSKFHAVGETYEVARVPVADAMVHDVTGDRGFGLITSGYGNGSAFVTLGGWGTPLPESEPTP